MANLPETLQLIAGGVAGNLLQSMKIAVICYNSLAIAIPAAKPANPRTSELTT